ncbi:YwaF family protein [Nocardioides sp. TF02-7]|uniref:TMEM164 family acyltransferase n=1 Tax=Nocardioides sp. TF02-7 TaxID=2917724 RepID=UPI001F05BB52|nr:YwaF family protein [Nocardioides sp. TF02-7]UMG92445.1 YwaF family protein [Nocardioides sp. TF02-7]
MWSAAYLVIGLRKPPRWRDYGAALAATLAWAVTAYAFNVVADTNYGYLVRKPSGSVLDYFGPWPWYVLQEVLVVAAGWALLTWATQRAMRPSRGSRRPRARSRLT